MWSLRATTFLTLFTTLFSALPAHAVNVVLSNDDGWAEINIRAFFNSLTAGGNSVIISAPAIDRSGTGSTDAPPTPLTKPCEFNSCPAGSPATGNNASMPRFNYVNSYPVTSMRYGIQTLSPTYFSSSGGKPDIAVAGPNVGANSGTTVLFSGTVGATTEAAKEGIPAIAFSGSTGSQTAWTSKPETYTLIYANLSTTVTNALTSANSGAKPYLPQGTWLNVNFPAVGSSSCNKAGSFRFVLSRINPAGATTAKDVVTCGNGGRLPTESTVLATKGGCYASISVGVATTKADASESDQAVVLGRLQGILSCLPS